MAAYGLVSEAGPDSSVQIPPDRAGRLPVSLAMLARSRIAPDAAEGQLCGMAAEVPVLVPPASQDLASMRLTRDASVMDQPG
jgi:hypothetical protein